MSTTFATIDTTKPAVPFSRLFKVELRKMFDTRSGFWLMFATGILIALAFLISLLVVGLDDGTEIPASGFSTIMTVVLSLLLPVFAIVTITSEWGQRSHLSLFTLEPRRARIIAAKLVSVLVLAVGTIVLAIILGAIGMPACCFLCAWRRPYARLFPAPVLLLVFGATVMWIGMWLGIDWGVEP